MENDRLNAGKSITIYDIAEEAGVSASTVSRVLNGSASVRKEKKDRIQSIIDKYNFKPNALAKGLSDTATKTIGIIAADVRNPYYSALFVACEIAAEKAGYSVGLANSLGVKEREQSQLDLLLQQKVDAIIQMGGRVDDLRVEFYSIRETIIAQLPEGQFTESLVAQLMEKVMKEKQSLEQGALQPSFKSVTGKGGIKVIDGSSVKFGRFDGAQPHCVGLTDLVTGDDGSSMAAGFMQWENAFFPWTLNYDEIDMVLEGELHVRHEGETMIAKAGDVMFIPKGSSIEFGTTSSVKFLYVAWPANWQSL